MLKKLKVGFGAEAVALPAATYYVGPVWKKKLRTMVQLLVAATEKVERDRVNGDAYAAAAAERSEDESAFTRASTRAAAHRRQRDP